MIAVLKRSGFHDRKWPQGVDYAGRLHALVFPGARNILPGDTSIAREREISEAFVSIDVHCLAHSGPCEFSVKRGIHTNAAEGVLIKHTFGRIAAGGTCHFIT